jgi:hypothetical protein
MMDLEFLENFYVHFPCYHSIPEPAEKMNESPLWAILPIQRFEHSYKALLHPGKIACSHEEVADSGNTGTSTCACSPWPSPPPISLSSC